jgi:PPOX class probable F420-dependent enzyme
VSYSTTVWRWEYLTPVRHYSNMSVQLPDLAKKLLDTDTFVTLTTVAKDGTPHSTVMWADRDGEDIIFATVIGRLKERHIRRDPRVSVSVFDPDNPYAYVTVNGTATLDPDGGPELIQSLSRKYTGERYSNDDGTDNVRVVVRVTPDRVYGH